MPTAACRRFRDDRSTATSSTFFGDPRPEPRERARQPHVGARRASRRRPWSSGTTRWSATTTASYQNFVPGAVNANQTQVALTAYNNATDRTNLVQSDRCGLRACRRDVWRHTLLAGAEVGRQLTDNFRNTGFFDNTLTTLAGAARQSNDRRAGDVTGRPRPTPTIIFAPTSPRPTRRIRWRSRVISSCSAVSGSIDSTCAIPQQPQRRHARSRRTTSCRRGPGSCVKPIAPAVDSTAATACRICPARAISSRR